MPYRWVILNQSQSPAFQAMLSRLADRLGPGLLLTGMPHPGAGPKLEVAVGPAYDRRGLKHRLLSWTRFMAWATAKMATVRGRPFVLAVTNPPMLPHLAWTLRRTRGLPYGLLVWDIYPDHLVETGVVGAGHPLARTWTALNRRVYTSAEVVVTLGERMVGALEAQLGPGAGRARFEVIPNWGDTEVIRPRPKEDNPFAREHGQLGRLTVLYSGNMGATHGLEGVVAAADRLRGDPRFSFLFIGDGLGRDAVAAEVARRGLENVKLLPLQPWGAVPLSLATGDVALVSQAPGTEHLSVPSKTYSNLAAGSALLALTRPDGDLADLVTRHDVGVVCPRDDVDGITAALVGLADDPGRLAALRANARAAAETKFSAAAVEERWAEVLAPLVGGAR